MHRKLRSRLSACTRGQRTALLCLLPFCLYGLLRLTVLIYSKTLMPLMPPCILRTFTGLKCPSCGMTHSVFALARLDLLTALRENAVIPALAVIALLRYAELWTAARNQPRRLVPRSGRFWWGFLAAALLYSVLRNL